MAQYTPNFNLYEPDSSDDFADFRTEFNNNMDIIDQNLGGGGGSGGHTIYDKDGNALAQESGLQFTGNVNVSDDSGNGRTVVDITGGGGNVYGAFLDPSRVIYSAFTFDSSTHSWTATEDCILTDNMTPPDGSTAYFIRIDGKQVFAGYNTVEDPFVYVKKGQVVEYRAKSGSTMKAYGILQGTNGIFAPVIYSDNERVIGVWRDNKPLYQKTVDCGLVTADSNWHSIAHGVSDMDDCVGMEAICIKTGTTDIVNGYRPALNLGIALERNGANLQYMNTWFGTGDRRLIVTLRYTKTTDVAGSGNWNTDGVPTHHYSTSEQVIGTWLGKPLYQRVWDFGSDLVIPNNSFYTTNIDASVIETIVEGFGIYSTGATRYNLMANTNGTNIRLQADRTNGSANVRYFVMSYTKTTDT